MQGKGSTPKDSNHLHMVTSKVFFNHGAMNLNTEKYVKRYSINTVNFQYCNFYFFG